VWEPPPREAGLVDFVVGLVRRFPFLVIIGIIVVGGIVFREHLPGAASDLRVGDCFDAPVDMDEIDDVQHRPCGDQHDAEVFGVFVHHAARGAAYPSVDAFDDYAFDVCLPAFESYTGVHYFDHADLEIGYFYPVQSSWSEGDRGITCYAYHSAGEKLTATVKATP
jgi:hypothetical protein